MEFCVVVLWLDRGGARVETSLLERVLGAVVERRIASAPRPDDVGSVDLCQLLLILDKLSELRAGA